MSTYFAEEGQAPPSIPSGSARARVCELLDRLLRITLSDGRVLVGKFTCFDKQRNILLTEAREQRYLEGGDLRAPPDLESHLGLVLVPRKYVTSCHSLAQPEIS